MRALAALGLCAACASAPPTDSRGLPRFSRYTNSAQLDFLLERYAARATVAAEQRDPGLLAQACLGYERTVFDLESMRRYPLIIRMGSEGAALVALRDELPGAMARRPLPAACARPAVGSAQAAEQAQAPAALPTSAVEQERAALAQLRALLPPLPTAHIAPEDAPAAPPAALDEPALAALAESALPAIRLRARYHQFGRCVQLVEATDRYPTLSGQCAGGHAGEAPRRGQARLLWAMLTAWRARYLEPMTDVVVGLANFASRDNPVTDGPRPTR